MEMLGMHRLLPFAVTLTIITMLSLQIGQAETLNLGKKKLSRLHFFFHDKVSGENRTAVQVASADVTNSSKTGFGSVSVIDDLLTEGPDPTSRVVGRAQGMYTSAGQEEVRLLMTLTYVIQSGKFNGSTLSVVGSNPVFNKVREMPIVGGSGAFRLATGYAQASTHTFDLKSGNAIVEYNVTVLHY